jgi:hypothetical protein
MKLSAGILFILLPVTAIAQNYQGMSERDMENMMQQMQTCMQSIDQSRMEEFEQRSNEIDAKVKSLCASGKRREAQQEATVYGRELASDPDIQKMTKCSQMMRGMMPEMPYMNQADVPDTSVRHVCD